jgi:hypothetical protein
MKNVSGVSLLPLGVAVGVCPWPLRCHSERSEESLRVLPRINSNPFSARTFPKSPRAPN